MGDEIGTGCVGRVAFVFGCGVEAFFRDMKKNQYNPAITATNAAVMKLLESSNERITDATMNTRQPCFENPNVV